MSTCGLVSENKMFLDLGSCYG